MQHTSPARVDGVIHPDVYLYHADCRDAMRVLPDNCIDSFVSDPPYHLTSVVKRFGGANAKPPKDYGPGNGLAAYARSARGFMGKQWDGGDIAFTVELWREVYRVLKPGAHLVAFGASRGYHRMACAIEDAGFEIRDSLMNIIDPTSPIIAFMESLNNEQLGAFLRCLDDDTFGGTLAYMYGVGFPKSHDVALDFETTLCDRVGNEWRYKSDGALLVKGEWRHPDAVTWSGHGTALKPAFEPIVLARKPLSEPTVAANVLRWRTGALNIDACRVPCTDAGGRPKIISKSEKSQNTFGDGLNGSRADGTTSEARWPANVVHDGSDEVVGAFPDSKGQQGDLNGTGRARPTKTCFGDMAAPLPHKARNDQGSAARFFYSAKASKADRAGSKHPTVKPVALMQWLCRLVTPPGGVILDPFAGSGTTAAAALAEGFKAVLCEREDEYVADIRRRIDAAA